MRIYQYIPFITSSNNGILQAMKSNEQIEKINFISSSVLNPTTSMYIPSNVLTLNDYYFITQENQSENANFLTIEFKDRFIYPNGYIIRSVNNPNYYYLRSWKLYCSFEGTTWTFLHSVDDKEYLSGGNIGRYAIKGGPFRYIKIVQTGPNKDPNSVAVNMYRMRVSYFDVFGLMTDTLLNDMDKTIKNMTIISRIYSLAVSFKQIKDVSFFNMKLI